MELDPVMTNSLEQQLGANLETGEDSDSEEGDMLPVEWEAVSLGFCVIKPGCIYEEFKIWLNTKTIDVFISF